MRAATVRRLALALPEAEERETWETPTFRVRNKIFVMFGDDERELLDQVDHDEQRALVPDGPRDCFVPPYVGSERMGRARSCRRPTATRSAS